MQNRQFVFALSLVAAIVLFAFVRIYALPDKKVPPPSDANPPMGEWCAIELRPPLPGGYSSLNLKGKLRHANDKWLVIYNDQKPNEGDLWIPRESVLLMTVGQAAKDYKGIRLGVNP